MRKTIGLLSVAVIAGFVATTMAEAQEVPNRCWGEIASQTAKLDTPEGTSGGGMGQHSRATKAADKNGGFANSNNAFGITFNTDGGRGGVGNVSRGAPHNSNNGQHAVNNSSMTGDDVRLDLVGGDGVVDSHTGLANTLNPVTGQLTTAAGGTAEVVDLKCDLVP